DDDLPGACAQFRKICIRLPSAVKESQHSTMGQGKCLLITIPPANNEYFALIPTIIDHLLHPIRYIHLVIAVVHIACQHDVTTLWKWSSNRLEGLASHHNGRSEERRVGKECRSRWSAAR